MVHIIDTHALVWFLEGNEKLGKRALRVLKNSREKLVIPSIVLAEVKYLSFKGRTRLSIESVFEAIEKDSRCVVYPLDSNVVGAMPTKLEIHDSIICGTALVYSNLLREEVKVISRDTEIKNSGIVRTLW